MKNIKTILLMVVPVLIVIGGCIFFIKLQDSQDPKTYQLYVKLDSLILFNFEESENPLITNYEFQNEEEANLFNNVNFTDLNVKEAIEKYVEIEKSNGVTLTNVYVWTNWDNSNYFEGNNYKVNIVDDETLSQVREITKPKLIYNQGYYQVDHEHNYNMVVKEDWSLEYHIDEYTTTFCDEYMEDSCFEVIINDEYYETASGSHTYFLSDGKITIKPKENQAYFGWVFAYDECEIMYNALKCNYYNGYHSEIPVYQHTVYYEIR